MSPARHVCSVDENWDAVLAARAHPFDGRSRSSFLKTKAEGIPRVGSKREEDEESWLSVIGRARVSDGRQNETRIQLLEQVALRKVCLWLTVGRIHGDETGQGFLIS